VFSVSYWTFPGSGSNNGYYSAFGSSPLFTDSRTEVTIDNFQAGEHFTPTSQSSLHSRTFNLLRSKLRRTYNPSACTTQKTQLPYSCSSTAAADMFTAQLRSNDRCADHRKHRFQQFLYCCVLIPCRAFAA
jgi:hypothetical protein